MKNTLTLLGTFLTIYGLSIMFTLLQSMLDVTNLIVLAFILPLPFFIAIYEYLYIRESKQAYKQYTALYKYDIVELNKQIANYVILDSSHQEINGKLRIEIKELKRGLSKEVIEKSRKTINIKDVDLGEPYLPFAEIPHYINQHVKVKYANEWKDTYITKILNEKPIKYRCYLCGSKKYKSSDMEVVKDEESD